MTITVEETSPTPTRGMPMTAVPPGQFDHPGPRRTADPLRSFLFVPVGRPDRVRRAATEYGADAVILDLEDAVPLAAKENARQLVGDLISELRYAPARVF